MPSCCHLASPPFLFLPAPPPVTPNLSPQADLRIWNVVRSAGEIAACMNRPVKVDTKGLVVNFLMNEGNGLSLVDRTEAHVVGIMMGCTWVDDIERPYVDAGGALPLLGGSVECLRCCLRCCRRGVWDVSHKETTT